MIRGTTPDIFFEADCDLSGANLLYITFVQDKKPLVEKTIDDVIIDENLVTLTMTEEEMLRFNENQPLQIQLRAGFPYGNRRLVSNIISTNVGKLLKDGEI